MIADVSNILMSRGIQKENFPGWIYEITDDDEWFYALGVSERYLSQQLSRSDALRDAQKRLYNAASLFNKSGNTPNVNGYTHLRSSIKEVADADSGKTSYVCIALVRIKKQKILGK